MVKKVIVVGGGSAGFMAALALKVKIPDLDVLVIRSKEIGIIGVGEGSTTALTRFLHNYLNVNNKKFYEQAQPIWKLGLRFLWGPRQSFMYSFGPGLAVRHDPMRKALAYYCASPDSDMNAPESFAALMTENRVFARGANGLPQLHPNFSYHVENDKFVGFLENYAAAVGVRTLEQTITRVRRGERGVEGLDLDSGQTESADLYVDCSGFASLLIGKTYEEPFISFKNSLFCDRAVVGGWTRADEPILPYTTCETMDSGWCWQIEHETRVNRGYVYASDFVDDTQAEAEFRAANPRVGPTRIVKFKSGYYGRAWIDNVVAIGNASGFVEPLEASALGVIAAQCRVLVGALLDADREIRPTVAKSYSDVNRRLWETVRAFIAIHYRFNNRRDTEFWKACREKTDLASAAPYVEYYQENGPSAFWEHIHFDPMDQFGAAGYVALLVGQCVPWQATHHPTTSESKAFEDRCRRNQEVAKRAMTVRESLEAIRSSKWDWSKNPVPASAAPRMS